ncbi:hypothetical protein [Streptomyces sp. MNP-20]|uniref:hypothetical protein n=1 Tax=Streptomyces sp. MNP-20 TaxID=2721165 RepID=UPI001C1E0430|nr:hypothetical protein [Streptomyces sp. MNP-20]
MSTEETDPPFAHPDEQVRRVAQDARATSRLLSSHHSALLTMKAALEVLQRETEVVCRGTRVEGDVWGQARWRSREVERSMNAAIRNLARAIAGVERSAHARHGFDEKVKEVKHKRRERARLRAAKRNPQLQAAAENSDPLTPQQNPNAAPQQGSSAYSGPTSIRDLRGRESA